MATMMATWSTKSKQDCSRECGTQQQVRSEQKPSACSSCYLPPPLCRRHPLSPSQPPRTPSPARLPLQKCDTIEGHACTLAQRDDCPLFRPFPPLLLHLSNGRAGCGSASCCWWRAPRRRQQQPWSCVWRLFCRKERRACEDERLRLQTICNEPQTLLLTRIGVAATVTGAAAGCRRVSRGGDVRTAAPTSSNKEC